MIKLSNVSKDTGLSLAGVTKSGEVIQLSPGESKVFENSDLHNREQVIEIFKLFKVLKFDFEATKEVVKEAKPSTKEPVKAVEPAKQVEDQPKAPPKK